MSGTPLSRFGIFLSLLLLAGSAEAQRGRRATVPPLGLVHAELAGRPLPDLPHFQHAESFNEGTTIHAAVDTGAMPWLVGKRGHLYVVEHRTAAEWDANPELVDVTGAPRRTVLTRGGRKSNTFVLDEGDLVGTTGTTQVSTAYDVVLDMDRDGLLGDGDVLDGGTDEAGFYVVTRLTGPGPYEVSQFAYNPTPQAIRQKIYHPTNLDELGELPVVVVSHGNGHNFQWYDHIGEHMASWGYVVMSHFNDTMPGPDSAATTTLRNANRLFAVTAEIGEGVLVGHLDRSQQVWIGHSRGAEGVALAHRRLTEGDPLVGTFGPEDVKLVSSMAPTDFLGVGLADVGTVPYSLWTGGADNDVNGCANCDICQTFHLHDRADGLRMSISLHGAGHGDFHDGGGSSVAAGPCRIGRNTTHAIMRGYFLALCEYVLDGDLACEEYLWRQWEDLRPLGTPTNDCVVVDKMFQEAPESGKYVLDDFQSQPEPGVSSSGATVVWSVDDLVEGRLNDNNNGFGFSAADPMNGMIMGGPGDTTRGVVFAWEEEDEFLLFEVPAEASDLRGYGHLSFRAAQVTRSAATNAAAGDLLFEVEVVDRLGRSSRLSIGAYGGGVEEPYQRSGCGGGGPGWGNEFETLRIPLRDFAANGKPIDLRNIVAVGFLFGPSHGDPTGRIGLDEIEFTNR